MSTPSPHEDDLHEFVVAPELAEVAKRLGVPLHAGDRVRFEVIPGGYADGGEAAQREPWPPAWVGSIHSDETDLRTRAREVMKAEFGQQ